MSTSLPSLVTLFVDRVASRPPAARPRAEGGVLAPGAGEHGEEPAAVLVDVGHVLGGGELAVGDVEEVAAPGEFAEEVPGLAVRAVVGGVAACDAEVHGHGAVAGDGEDVQELFQVGAVVLVVAPGDGRSGACRAGCVPRSAAS